MEGAVANRQAEKQTRFIGVLMYDTPGSSALDLAGRGFLTGLSEGAAAHNASLVVHRFGGDNRQILDAARQPAAMRDGLLEGLALIHRFEPEVVRELAMRLPVVSLTHFVPGVRTDLVDSDHIGAIAKMVDRLHEHGHRRIGFVGRAPNLSYSQARFGSFCQSMARLGLEVDPAASVNVFKEIADLDRQADLVTSLIRKRGYTGFVCASDLVGYQTCRRLIDRGVRVPQDVSLTGFDALDPLNDCPALTSVARTVCGPGRLCHDAPDHAHPKAGAAGAQDAV